MTIIAPERKVRVKTEHVTPELAKTWLNLNVNNRRLPKPLEDPTVIQYAADMRAGRWHLTGDSIKFSTDDTLLDGQHRLYACVMAETPFVSSVAYGVPDDARIVIDTGKKRTLGQYLQMSGEKDTNALAAASTMTWRYQAGALKGDGTLSGGSRKLSHETAVRWIEENPGMRESVALARTVYRQLKLSQTSIAATHYLNSLVDAEAADEFWVSAREGVGLPAGSPILALQRWIMGVHRAPRKPLPDTVFAYYLKAMMFWKLGKKVNILIVRSGEKISTWDDNSGA